LRASIACGDIARARRCQLVRERQPVEHADELAHRRSFGRSAGAGQRHDGAGPRAAHERVALGRQAVRNLAHRLPQIALQRDAIGLVGVGRRHERRVAVGDLEQLDRVREALQPPVTVGLKPPRARVQRRLRRRGEQDLPAQRDRHHAARDHLRDALDLERLRAARDVVRSVRAQPDRADVQPGARRQRRLERTQRALTGQRVADGVVGGVEEQQHAVGLVDLAPAPLRQQVARHPVMRPPDLGHRQVTQRLRQLGAVDHVGQQKDTHVIHRLDGRRTRSPMRSS